MARLGRAFPNNLTLRRVRPQVAELGVVNVSPVTITLSVVAPTLVTEVNVSPLTITLSPVTPTLVTEVNTAPQTITLTTVAPLLITEVNTAPLTITLTTVAPLLSTDVNVAPQVITLTTVAPTLVTVVNTTPLVITLSVVAASFGGAIFINVSPVTITLSVVAPLLITEVNTAPVSITLSTVNPTLVTEVNVAPRTITLTTVNPTLVTEVNVAPRTITLSVVAALLVTEVNVSPQTIFLSVVEATHTGFIPPVLQPEIVGIQAKDNLFAAFTERLKFISPITSEFVHEHTEFPYASLCQLYNVLSWKNSCLERFEEANFRISVYAEGFWELEEKVSELEETLLYDTLFLRLPKRLISLQQIEKNTEELIPSLYRSQLIYETIVQKQIDQTYIRDTTSGETLNKAIYNRFKSLPLAGIVNDLVSPGYALENTPYPYLVVPKIEEKIAWWNTLGRVDETKYPITIFSEDLNELIEIMDEVEKSYDYAKFLINERRHMINEWVGTNIIELQPQLWCGKVNYEILVERDIN